MFNPDIQRKLQGKTVKAPTIKDKLTNRQLRDMNFLSLARRLKPKQVKALGSMIQLLDQADAPGVRYNAAKFIVEFYLDVVKSLYKEKYDNEQGEDIQPVFQVIDSTNVAVMPEPEAKEESDNRRLREKQLLMLSRKLKPHVKKAIATVEELIDTDEAGKFKCESPAVRFQASKFLIMINKQLTESIYNDKYDEEVDKENEDAVPVFSLRMQAVNGA